MRVGERILARDPSAALTFVVLLAFFTALGMAAVWWPDRTEAPPRPDGSVVGTIVETLPYEGGLSWIVSQAGSTRVASLVWAEDVPSLSEGDRVRLVVADEPPVEVPEHLRVSSYARLLDFERSSPLLVLAGLFVLAVVLVGRWWGLRAIFGLGFSLAVVLIFVIPAILSGAPPPTVAWSAATIIMTVTLYLTHGVSRATTVAAAATTLALTLTVALGSLFVAAAKITGFASEEAQAASLSAGGLSLSGLVLAGLIIATLGVLDDVTVTQTSTVYELARTSPDLSYRGLFASGMRVGRDHIASVVNTLFLAYTGASLATLVLFETSGLPASEIISSELVAEEVVKTLVGSVGLVVAVPLTTALAAYSARGRVL